MEQLKLDQFYDYRFLSELAFSPKGTKAACVVTRCDPKENGYASAIHLYEEGTWRQLTGLGEERGFVWEDDTHILFPAFRSKEEKQRREDGEKFTVYYRISTQGGEALPAFELPFPALSLKRLDGDMWLVTGSIDANRPNYDQMTREEREKAVKEDKDNEDYQVLTEIPFCANGGGYVDKKRTALFLYDAAAGTHRRISPTLCRVMYPVVLDRKVYFLGLEYEHVANYSEGSIYRYDLDRDTLTCFAQGDWAISSLSALDGKLIATAGPDERYVISPEDQFYEVDPVSGALSLFAANQDALDNATGSDCRWGRVRFLKETPQGLYFTKTMRSSCWLCRLNPDGTVTDVITREGSVDDYDVTEDGHILVTGLFDSRLQEVYALEAEGTLRQVSFFNTEVLQNVYVATPRKMTIQSQGWDIDGWVLLPKDYDETKQYPAILDIHGGPRTVYGEMYFHEMQYWANLGYFVFFCNPVGGSGRGLKFADIGGRYGDVDFANLMDFTDAVLQAYPQIDPNRVGCTGGSYGGFMSNWILGHTNRFAAIATQRSISNWISFYGMSDIGFHFAKSQLGADLFSEEGLKEMWRQSPLKYINQMETPTLILHSTEDYRCPLEQGQQLFTALTEKGVPTRMICFKGENHELSRSGKPLHRARRLREITEWMDRYTGPAPEEGD